jgi:hypothetical protein
LKMEKISPKLVEEWRFGRVPYLERVLNGNLGQLSFIMAKFRERRAVLFHALHQS